MWAHLLPTLPLVVVLLVLMAPAVGSKACVVSITGGDDHQPVSLGRTCEAPTNFTGECACCGVNASIYSTACSYKPDYKICGCGGCPVSSAFRSTDSVKASTGISLFCCALVIVVMGSSNKFRRHPNNYIFTKCVADIIFAAFFLHHQVQQDEISTQQTQRWTSPSASPPLPSFDAVTQYMNQHAKPDFAYVVSHYKYFHGCSPLSAGLTQFGMIVSVLTFGLIPIDSYVAMNYPFGNMDAFARKYQLIIIIISVVSALILTYGDAYGAGYGLCWVCGQNAEKGEGFKVNLWRLFLMYLPIVGTMISNVVFMSVIYNRLLGCDCVSWLCKSPQVRAAGADSETLRKDVFKSGFTYTVLFTVYWVAVLIPYVICMYLEAYGADGEPSDTKLYNSSANAFVGLLGLQGVVDAVVFAAVNWKYLMQSKVLCCLCRSHRVTSVSMEDEEDIAARQYVKALRTEVFEYVAQGVHWSVDRTRARMLGTQSQRGREENNTLQLKKAHVDVPGITSMLPRTNAGTEIDVPTSAFVQSGEVKSAEMHAARWQTYSGARTSDRSSAPDGSARPLDGKPSNLESQSHRKAFNASRLQFTSDPMEQNARSARGLPTNRESTRGYPMFRRVPSTNSSTQASSNDLSEPLLSSTSGDDNSNDFEESIRFKTQQRKPQRKGLLTANNLRSLNGMDSRKSVTGDKYGALPSLPSSEIRLQSDPRNSDIEFQVEANVSHTSSSGETTQFRFVDHQPKMFWQLREQLGIDHDEFVSSVTAHASEKFSEGASGAFMYYSQDNQYIVKTHEWEEMITLMDILEDYLTHFRAHKNSLLNQYLGAYSIQLYSQYIHFIIMRNCFADAGSRLEIYDLKGSYVNRNGKRAAQLRGERKHCKRCNQVFIVGDTKTPCPEAVNQQTHVPRVVLKDNDLNFRVNLNAEQRREMARQIRCDVKFLEKKGLMDYSLLLGVKKRQVKVQPRSDGDSGVTTSTGCSRRRRQSIMQGKFSGQLEAEMVEGPGVYYVGIVDILQRWTFAKKAERFAKVVLKCLWQQRDGLSAIPPRLYRKRFDHRVVRALLKTPDADDSQFRGGGVWSDDDDSVGSSMLQLPQSSDHSVQ